MTFQDDIRRVATCCTDCGSVYAARRWPDGTLRIIGRDGCQCGSNDLTVVDDPDEVDGDGKNPTDGSH